MRYVVTGGRDYRDRAFVFKRLTEITQPGDFIIMGDADGVDKYALEWAKAFGHPHRVVRAPWLRLRKGAGHLRNGYMLDLLPKADMVIAFPGHEGTENCKKQARDRDIPVLECQ